jgi:hypothetical protein
MPGDDYRIPLPFELNRINAEAQVLAPKAIIDVLSAGVGPTFQWSTFNYRIKGMDTLTIGDQGCWVKVREARRLLSANVVGRYLGQEFFEDRVEEYIDLRKALRYLCSHRRLDPKISYRNPMAVEAYLTRHPEVVDFIEMAWPYLVSFFGQEIDVALEVLTYPEEAAHEELVGWVQWPGDVHEGLERLERFDDEWFLDHMTEVETKFNFNIETK